MKYEVVEPRCSGKGQRKQKGTTRGCRKRTLRARSEMAEADPATRDSIFEWTCESQQCDTKKRTRSVLQNEQHNPSLVGAGSWQRAEASVRSDGTRSEASE